MKQKSSRVKVQTFTNEAKTFANEQKEYIDFLFSIIYLKKNITIKEKTLTVEVKGRGKMILDETGKNETVVDKVQRTGRDCEIIRSVNNEKQAGLSCRRVLPQRTQMADNQYQSFVFFV